jgi:ABC-type nitrate/sulfonate/bicarbonate transport system substrate-binding protein
VDTAYALVLRRVLLAHGLEMERGDYRPMAKGTTEYRLDSMIQGETFAGVLNAPWDAKAAAAGMVRFADHREVLPDYPGGVFAVSRRWATENRALLVKYLRVWNDALGWAHEEKNRGEALRLITTEEKLDEKGAARKLAQLPASGNLNLTDCRACSAYASNSISLRRWGRSSTPTTMRLFTRPPPHRRSCRAGLASSSWKG